MKQSYMITEIDFTCLEGLNGYAQTERSEKARAVVAMLYAVLLSKCVECHGCSKMANLISFCPYFSEIEGENVPCCDSCAEYCAEEI